MSKSDSSQAQNDKMRANYSFPQVQKGCCRQDL